MFYINSRHTFLFLFAFLFFSCNLCGQKLSVDEAVEYLENVLEQDILEQQNIYRGERSIKVDVFDDEISIKYIWGGNKDVLYDEYHDSQINYNEIIFNINDVSEVFKRDKTGMKTVALSCKDKTKRCFTMEYEAIKTIYSNGFSDRPQAINHYKHVDLFFIDNLSRRDKVIIALDYILDEQRKKVNDVEDNTLYDIVNKSPKQVVVDLEKSKGVSRLTVNIGGMKARVILDSGASDVSVSSSFESTLLEKGIIDSEDYLPSGLYMIADGSIMQAKRFVVPYIKIGDLLVKDVPCSTNTSENTILLGKSFLDRFKRWEINNETNKLILKP